MLMIYCFLKHLSEHRRQIYYIIFFPTYINPFRLPLPFFSFSLLPSFRPAFCIKQRVLAGSVLVESGNHGTQASNMKRTN